MGKREKGAKRPAEQPARRPGKIRARVLDEVNGCQVLEHIRAVRIRSREYSLLVMEDYTPTLGSIDGDVIFVGEEETALRHIQGFYKHQQNEFSLLIREDQDGAYEKL